MTDADILRLWRSGLDTYAIALQLGGDESEVANRLAGIRYRGRSTVHVVTFGRPPTTSIEDYP